MEMEKEVPRNNVLIFDWNNLVFRTLHVANFSASDEEIFIYWKYLIINSLFTSIKKFNPSKVIIAIDGLKNWRKEVYTEYKAQRKVSREKSTIDFKEFFKILDSFNKELKEAFSNIHFLKLDEAEADDIIAILTKETLKDLSEVTLISTDKDFIQLLSCRNFKLYNPIKKNFVKSLNPKIDLQLKILTGDKSDNIPSVKNKVGPKTAQKILSAGIDKYKNDELFMENYRRNERLIDFNFIPKSINLKIKKLYESYELKPLNVNVLWKFMIKNRIAKFADDLKSWAPMLIELN